MNLGIQNKVVQKEFNEDLYCALPSTVDALEIINGSHSEITR